MERKIECSEQILSIRDKVDSVFQKIESLKQGENDFLMAQMPDLTLSQVRDLYKEFSKDADLPDDERYSLEMRVIGMVMRYIQS